MAGAAAPFEGSPTPGSSKVSKGSGSLHMSKGAKTPKTSHTTEREPRAALQSCEICNCILQSVYGAS
eukprot:4411855-Prymnesium_polylepis.1